MKDVRTVLERESLRHELPAGSFDRLTRKRDRRRGNQRISAGVVAFAVVAAAFTGALDLLHQGRVLSAAQAITPQNVGRLQLQWSGLLDGSAARLSARPYGDGPFSPVATGDLVLIASQRGTLFAFPTSCTSSCRPAWTAPVEGGVSYPPTVADGVAYVVSATGHVAAYSLTCATNGSVCSPIWTGRAGHGIYSSPVVSDGMLFGIDASSVYAFSTSCGTNGAVCAPAWTTYVGPMIPGYLGPYKPLPSCWLPSVIAPTVSGGVVVAPDVVDRSLHALDATTGHLLWVTRSQGAFLTDQAAGIMCRASPSGLIDAPIVSGDTVYWAGGPSVYGYPVSCRTDGKICRARWRSTNGAFSQPVVSGAEVFVPDVARRRIDAFVGSCSKPRGACHELWHLQLPGGQPEGGVAYAQISEGSGHLIVSYSYGAHRVSLLPSKLVRVASYPTDCVPVAGLCPPEWLTTPIPDKSLAPVAIVDGVGYMGTTSGHVYAFPEACSSCGAAQVPSWDYMDPTGNRGLSTPAVVGGRVYVAAGDGRLLAFGLPTPPVPPAQPASKRSAAIFYLAVALAGAAFLAARMLRKRRRGSASAA